MDLVHLVVVALEGLRGLGVVAAGFEALRATTTTRPRPFRAGRDGMSVGEGAAARRISAAQSRAEVWVIPTDEEAMIARHTLEVLGGGGGTRDGGEA